MQIVPPAMDIPALPLLILALILRANGASEQEVIAVLGRTATLPCRIDFSGDPTVIWHAPNGDTLTRNEDIITEDPRVSIDRPYRKEWNLVISDVTTSDQGQYTCMIVTNTQEEKHVQLLIHYAPTITQSSSDVTVETNVTVALECEADGFPRPNIRWYRYAYNGDRISLGLEGSQIWINDISREEAGTYECEADNSVPPDADARMTVDVLFAPVIQLPHEQISQSEGQDTLLECFITANPATDFHWEKDGQRLEDIPGKYRIFTWDIESYTKTLGIFIFDLHSTDYGAYTCVSVNKYGRAAVDMQLYEWHTGHMRVLSPPEDTVARPRQDVRLNCTVEGMSHKDSLIWWRHTALSGHQRIFVSHPATTSSQDGVPAPLYRNVDKYSIVGHYNLVIRNISLQDSGDYMCEVVGKHNHTARVTVIDELQCGNNGTEVVEGRTAILSCTLSFAGPALNWLVEWQHGDRKLSSIKHDDKALMVRTAEFPAFLKDSGKYECAVSSDAPEFHATCQTEITVKSPRPTSAPVCSEAGVDNAWLIMGVSMFVASILFLFCIAAVCLYYRRRLKKYSRPEPSARYQKNGALSLETEHLTAPEINEQEV